MATRCVAALRDAWPEGRFELIQSYRGKPDHGDADILCCAEGYDPFLAAETLGAVEIVRNGPVTSMGVVVRPEIRSLGGNVFQVDLVNAPADAFDFCVGYFAWNDMGNLLGRVARAMRCVLRSDGLYYYCRQDTYKFAELLLTQDFEQALIFLGYDPVRYREGFNSLEEIYAYVASSPYFSRVLYRLENRNATARVRDAKRPTYHGFLLWCDANPDLPEYFHTKEDAPWLPRIAEHFAHFQAEYDAAWAQMAASKAAAARFNGEWVSQLTGLQGKALGALMRRVKDSFESPEAMREFVLTCSTEELAARVLTLQGELSAQGESCVS